MPEFDHTATRRGALKLTGAVPFVPTMERDSKTTLSSAANIVMTPADIPDEYDEFDNKPDKTDFYRTLSQVHPGTEDADMASRLYLNTDLPSTGIGSTAFVFDDPPRPRTVIQTMTDCFDRFVEEFETETDGEIHVRTRTDAVGREWHIDIPDPEWYPASAYADVSRIELIGSVVLSVVVYGPVEVDLHPQQRARRFAVTMRSRVRQGVLDSDA